jgi:hypothetical protein
MRTSDTINNLSKALLIFNVKVDTIKKDAKNPFFKSTYASLTNIIDSIKEPMIESGLVLVQFPEGLHHLTTRLIHSESGEWMESEYAMKPVKDDPQGIGSVLTYMRRYAIASILNLSIDEDDDANAASQKPMVKEDNKVWLNKGTKQFDAVVERLNAKTTTIDEVKKHMKVSKEVETLLLNSIK